MSIAVARITESDYKYRIAGISHPRELARIVGKYSHLVQVGLELPAEVLIPLLENQNLFLDDSSNGEHSTVSGLNTLKGGVLLRTPGTIFEIGVNQYFAGYGLLLVGFLTLNDLEVNKDLIPDIVGDKIRRGMW